MMAADADALLAEIRNLVPAYRDAAECSSYDEEHAAATELADSVEALDEHLTAGNLFPAAWLQTSHAILSRRGDAQFTAIRAHIANAVLHELPRYGGHDRGGSVSSADAWRQASPEALAEQIATFAMAAISPVAEREMHRVGVAVLRDLLDDPKFLASQGLTRTPVSCTTEPKETTQS